MRTQGRKQEAESRNQKSEDRSQKAGGWGWARTRGERPRENRRQGFALVAAMVCLMGLSFLQNGLARQPEPSLTFTVGIYDYAHASPATLAGAEREAGRILGVAGVQVAWRECGTTEPDSYSQSPCQKSAGRAYIELRILAQPNKSMYRNDPLGFAIAPAMANVYYHKAMLFVGGDGAGYEGQTILGCVMAHEIGHLLLGSNSHSDSGIMRATWEHEDMQPQWMGRRLFTSAQGKLIRAEVKRRGRPLKAGTPQMDSAE
jgi:hypothetical protein